MSGGIPGAQQVHPCHPNTSSHMSSLPVDLATRTLTQHTHKYATCTVRPPHVQVDLDAPLDEGLMPYLDVIAPNETEVRVRVTVTVTVTVRVTVTVTVTVTVWVRVRVRVTVTVS